MRTLTIALILTSSSALLSQQQRLDSLEGLYKKQSNIEKTYTGYHIAKALPNQQLDSSIYYLKEAIKSPNDSLIALSSLELADIYKNRNVHIDSALYYIDIGMRSATNLENNDFIYNLRKMKAYSYSDNFLFSEAIALHLENSDLGDQLGRLDYKASALSGIGEAYRLQKNGPSAVKYLEQANEVASQLSPEYANMKFGIALNLALAYDANNEQLKSFGQLQKLLESPETLTPFNLALVHHNIGRSYNLQKQYDKAIASFLRSLSIDQWANLPRRKIASLKELTLVYINTDRTDEAVETGETAYQLAEDYELQYHIEDVTRNLSNALENKGEYKRSLMLQKEYAQVLRSIFNEDKNSLMLEMDAQYQTSEKEKALQQLNNIQEVAKRNKIILTISIAAAIAILSLLWYNRKRRNDFLLRQQKLKVKTEQDEKELIALRLENEKIESERQRREKEVIALEVQLKDRELTTNAMTLLQQKEQYESLVGKLKTINPAEVDGQFSEIKSAINEAKASVNSYNWDEFKLVFEKVHVGFYDNLLKKFPNITPNEKKLCAFLRLGMNTKDISAITNQTPHTIRIARSRLRKKLGLVKEDSLSNYISTL